MSFSFSLLQQHSKAQTLPVSTPDIVVLIYEVYDGYAQNVETNFGFDVQDIYVYKLLQP